MKRDLAYKETPNHRRIALTYDKDFPDILKRAITLMLFSKDPDIRNFNGSSVVTAFSSLPQSGFDGISFYLTVAANRLRDVLQGLDNRVSDVYFESRDDGGKLIVTLNIKIGNDTLTSVVYG